jgi:mannitol-1-phosphate 5-dehydrogenase
MKTAVQFGAGNIGRGFMGQLFWEAGYKTVFIEAQEGVVRLLNERGKYPLMLLDAYTKKEMELVIDGVEAVSVRDVGKVGEAILRADVVGTAVGVKNLAGIAPLVAAGIKERRAKKRPPVDIYLCENVLDAAESLRKAVIDLLGPAYEEWVEANVGFVGTSVARMVPAASGRFGSRRFGSLDPLFVVADSYHKLPYDGKAVRADRPPIEGMKPVKNFKAEVERKLFTYNLGHAALAYLGHLKGYAYVHEPFGDGDLMPIVEGALDETGETLLAMYPVDLDPAGQEEVREDIRVRFGNPLLMDTMQRVGRDPLRKLGPNDRLVGSAKLCLNHGVFPRNIATVCGAALLYDHPEDPDALALQSRIESLGVEKTMRDVSGVEPASDFGKAVVGAYRELREKRKEWKR